MRQLQYVAERRTKTGVVKLKIWAVSLLQAVDQARLKTQQAHALGISGYYRVISFIDVDGKEVRF